jgi:hypothetical protein
MPPQVGKNDRLERIYTSKFCQLISEFGEVIKYNNDRAALDLGLHITKPSLTNEGGEDVTNVRVWFQLKGYHTKTLSREKFEKKDFISYDKVSVEHLKFWYAFSEPVYFTLYIESIDSFFSEDVRDIVDRDWGQAILNPATFGAQKTTTIRLDKKSHFTKESLSKMFKHRSLRIDTPSFRGQSLGHRIDPLRSILEEMEPDIFQALVMRFLKEYKYEIEEGRDLIDFFPSASGDIAKLLYGTMYSPYECVYQMTTQFVSENGKFRRDGEPNFVQGKCAVLIHSKKVEDPHLEKSKELLEEMSKKNIEHFLVFVNSDLMQNNEYTGQFVSAYRETNRELKHRPQGLGEISFTLLTSNLVYLDFCNKISFKLINYLWD